MPEPGQASWPAGVMMPGLVTLPGLVTMPGLVSLPDLHDIQDAPVSRLQHVNNSHPGATAKHAQPGQAGPSAISSLSSQFTHQVLAPVR